MNEQHIVRHLIMSSYTPPSIDAVRPHIPRWIKRLNRPGVRTAEQVESELNLLMLQVIKRPTVHNEASAHHLRNILRTRPWHL
jgi:hypothetical protein